MQHQQVKGKKHRRRDFGIPLTLVAICILAFATNSVPTQLFGFVKDKEAAQYAAAFTTQIDLNIPEAIVIPGIGVLPDGKLPPWSLSRADAALAVYRMAKEQLDREGQTSPFPKIICLSDRTVHKPPPLDPRGFAIKQSTAMAQHLIANGVPPSDVLEQGLSYDTIGDAFFLRTLHTDVSQMHRIVVVANSFHLPRVRAIFDLIFSLKPCSGGGGGGAGAGGAPGPAPNNHFHLPAGTGTGTGTAFASSSSSFSTAAAAVAATAAISTPTNYLSVEFNQRGPDWRWSNRGKLAMARLQGSSSSSRGSRPSSGGGPFRGSATSGSTSSGSASGSASGSGSMGGGGNGNPWVNMYEIRYVECPDRITDSGVLEARTKKEMSSLMSFRSGLARRFDPEGGHGNGNGDGNSGGKDGNEGTMCSFHAFLFEEHMAYSSRRFVEAPKMNPAEAAAEAALLKTY